VTILNSWALLSA